MKRFLILLLAAVAFVADADAKKEKGTAVADAKIRAEIAATPEKSGGYYYAYPYTSDVMPEIPVGFEPVYISHYGRHGSRWVDSSKLHKRVLDVLYKQKKAGNLTATGEEIIKIVEASEAFSNGHYGELTRLGEQQHAGIAKRMYTRFPQMFRNGKHIVARSSDTPRCIISMAAFCEALKEQNPSLNIEKHASPGDSRIIKFHSPEELDVYYDTTQVWRKSYFPKRDSLYRCVATAKKIFKNPKKVKTLPQFMKYLQDVGKAFQNLDGFNYNLLGYFEDEDLYNLWKGEDYMNYVRHGNAIETDCAGAKSGVSLLRDILAMAEDGLDGKRTDVDLRFGHDVYLMNLYSLMDVTEMSEPAKGIDEASRLWQSYRVTPMAGNLQIVIFRNKHNQEIASVRINERPAQITGLKEFAPGFYKWEDLKTKWNGKINAMTGFGKPCEKVCSKSCKDDARCALEADPAKAGGMYYVYPYTTDSLAPLPKGFEPVYLSHYGRHGSRWVLSTRFHPQVIKKLTEQQKRGNLTPLGEEVLRVIRKSEAYTEGHIGELAPLGVKQHKAIANRMYKRFPNLFEATDTVQARSSTVPRCITSMTAFSEGLKENNPKLTVLRHATPSDMDIIIYKTPDARKLESSDSLWRVGNEQKIVELQRSEATATKLFKDVSKVKDLHLMMDEIREIATHLQNIPELQEDILYIFEPEDLYNQWLVSNYRLYVKHGNAKMTDGCGPKSSKALVRDIVNRANASLAGKGASADLRFGHDTGLMKLLAFMNVDGVDAAVEGIEETAKAWKSYYVTPMGANFQMILFRNKAGKTLAGFRLNEQPVLLNGIKQSKSAPGYYDWEALSEHLLRLAE